jgi:acyl-CoA dehydrogenase
MNKPDWIGVCAVAAEHAVAVDRDGRFPAEAVAALKAHGALGAMIPVEYGGEGASMAKLAVMCRDLGSVCSSTAMVFAMQQSQVACLVAHHSNNPWQLDFMRKVAAEGLLLASITSEEGVGGRIRTSRCAIEMLGGGRFRLAKDGSTISYGADADAYVATTRRGPDADASDQVLVVLPRADCTVERYRGWDSLGMRGTGSGAFHVTGEGDIAQILPVPFGEIAGRTMLPVAHILWGAVWLGIASDVATRCRAYIRSRMRAKPNAADHGLARLARMSDMLFGMDARLRRALDLYESGRAESDAVELMLVKTVMSETALEVAQLGLQICGFSAYSNTTPYSLGRHLRDLHSAPLMVGNEDIRGDAGQLLLLHRPKFGDFTDGEG